MVLTKIKKNKDFKLVYRKGKSYADSNLVVYVMKNNENKEKDINRVGITVSKKVGKSVVRNRVRRIIYECYRLEFLNIKSGYDFVIIARPAIKGKSYNEVLESMKNVFNRIGFL